MTCPCADLQAIAIVGPTAVGKSDAADHLAARLSSEVLSCDAMQIYRGMDIGTAKMTPEECTVPLRLVDIVEPGFAYSAARRKRIRTLCPRPFKRTPRRPLP